MGGSKSVNPGQYITRPDNTIAAMTLQAQLAADNLNYKLALLNFEQQSKGQERGLRLAAQLRPNLQSFNAAKTSEEAGELGMANLQRSREFEKLSDPDAAKMRREMSKKVAEATSADALQKYMNEWAKTKGIGSILQGGDGMYGVSPDSTFARSAIFDKATQAAREFNLANLAAQQSYLSQNAAPVGGLDPGSLMEAKRATEGANLANLTGWQQNIINAARGMQVQQPAFLPTQGYQSILSLDQANKQNLQNYQNMMYQGAAANAAGQNQMTGAYIGAGGAIIGAGLGAVII